MRAADVSVSGAIGACRRAQRHRAAGGAAIAPGSINKEKAAAAPAPAAETAGLQYVSPVWMRNGAGAGASFKF